MRNATVVLAAAALCWLFPTQSAGQNMMQYGLAAGAGSVAGTAAGKQVSNGITAIFGKTAKAAQKAAGQDEASSLELSDEEVRDLKRKQAADAERLRLEREAAAKRYQRNITTTASTRVVEETSNSWMPTPFWLRRDPILPPAPPVRQQVTQASIGQIDTGFSREAVFGQLGTPAARVVIPEGNHINEVLYYQSNGETVGAVRLSSGTVSGVVINNN